MDSTIVIAFFLIVFVGLPVGLGLLLYFVTKKLGYPKVAKYLTVIYGVIVLTIGTYVVFEDYFFTKKNAKELIEEQNIILIDDFELLKNESMSAVGDYYHTFTLKVSESDKQDAILRIKSADNFKAGNSSTESLLDQEYDQYFGKKISQNYETESSFVREYFQPSGQKGYAPIFRRISVSKINNELIFEDIDQ